MSRFCRRPLHTYAHSPSVSIVVAARNEERLLEQRIANLLGLHYDRDRFQIIIASDGSTDSTASLLLQHKGQIQALILDDHQGKAVALNEAVKLASGDILIFFDVRQRIDENAILELVLPFSDPTVGAVSGSLEIEKTVRDGVHGALGRYWEIEKSIRALESVSGSCVGATGAIYAVRRELYTPMPRGTILDDVFIPMHVGLRRKRVIFHSKAIARDKFSQERSKEFTRKVRTLNGNLQLLALAPWLITHRNPLLFRFLSHKVLRLLSPILLIVLLVTSAGSNGEFYKGAFTIQVLFYLCAGLGGAFPRMRKTQVLGLIYTFVDLNLAALIALLRFVLVWRPEW